ncbi:PadR family transcriptional regulator [Cellulosimicrobium protaetiae]|uniref:Helix-turn-helix transcriptional regulator n=1 Tax=Cellulosimicrobium protaetiae TaxID=2587808 RepID=A0A6M5UFU5_9MICO|nr:PadR family transcriptional regulator [Cellulosimicrobium protaetiae]QJW36155.1 helix-turn-helix transcriptional regulator [Cellulosimicrobium protaetiae]
MATVFAHGQLRLYLLALLDSGPKHGYELITELSDRFGGTYRPSAGTIYPRLARLEDEGLVHRSADGRKTTYELTPAGRAEIEARRDDVAALEHGIAETVRQRAEALRADVQGSLQGLRAELAAAAQTARARPREGEPDPRRRESYAWRMEAEAVLQRFREDVRADLRRADAASVVSELTVDTLRTVLDSARKAVRATLP